jgi:hypothetical protein
MSSPARKVVGYTILSGKTWGLVRRRTPKIEFSYNDQNLNVGHPCPNVLAILDYAS